mmetsp:Transcript_19332/g.31663  ORF Transcript_19332/g.31663 Transcript_19332/m.31663 type:complete len:504 (-) Transcript_19332:185-1696(-)
MSEAASTIVSAPGKVLITGGYLVLERPNRGLVVSVGSRFYTIIESLARSAAKNDFEDSTIEVVSPQFNKTEKFTVRFSPTLTVRASDSTPNPFIHFAVQHVLLVAWSLLGESFKQRLGSALRVTILGSNDYYSQREQIRLRGLSLNSKSLAALPKFLPPDITSDAEGKKHVAKTGLGSSAALVTSLVASLLHHLKIVSLDDSSNEAFRAADLELVHVISQYSHCRAQGKIGSGFDVSAATFGSQRYVRFSPTVLNSLLNSYGPDDTPTADSVVTCVLPGTHRLASPHQEQKHYAWNHEHVPFVLPKGLGMMVGEVDGGSNTPLLVSQVLKWKATKVDEANENWRKLSAANDHIEEQFHWLVTLRDRSPDEYEGALNVCGRVPFDGWSEKGGGASSQVVTTLIDIHNTFTSIRELLREMGSLAGVPIEPSEQTHRADVTMTLPGVLMSGVPGAGGFDAIFAIFIEGPARSAIEESWLQLSVCPLLCSEPNTGVSVHRNDPRTLG